MWTAPGMRLVMGLLHGADLPPLVSLLNVTPHVHGMQLMPLSWLYDGPAAQHAAGPDY